MKLGDFLTAINKTRKALMDEDEFAEKEYPAFVVNKSLSYFIDTAIYANEMNQRHWIDPKLQFDYLRIAIRAKSRFSKWIKPSKNDRAETIKNVYGYSTRKALEVVDLITDDQYDELLKMLNTGGKKR